MKTDSLIKRTKLRDLKFINVPGEKESPRPGIELLCGIIAVPAAMVLILLVLAFANQVDSIQKHFVLITIVVSAGIVWCVTRVINHFIK